MPASMLRYKTVKFSAEYYLFLTTDVVDIAQNAGAWWPCRMTNISERSNGLGLVLSFLHAQRFVPAPHAIPRATLVRHPRQIRA
jgi:hypothetical protein